MSHGRREKPAPPAKPATPANPALLAAKLSPNGELNVMAAALMESRKALETYQATHKYTEEQMLKAIREGVMQGWQDGYTEMLKTVYAATAYVMRREYGWGVVRLSKLMEEIDQRVYTTINHSDLVEQLDEEYSISLDLDDMIHRVVITGPGKGGRKCRR